MSFPWGGRLSKERRFWWLNIEIWLLVRNVKEGFGDGLAHLRLYSTINTISEYQMAL